MSSTASSCSAEAPRAQGRRISSVPEQVSLPTDARMNGRAFGASALHDEAVLDIPAYLRRGAAE